MLIILIRAGMVLTNIRIWRDFTISRDFSLVTKEAMKYKPKTSRTEPNITKKTKGNKLQDIEEIESKDIWENDSDETITEMEKVSERDAVDF